MTPEDRTEGRLRALETNVTTALACAETLADQLIVYRMLLAQIAGRVRVDWPSLAEGVAAEVGETRFNRDFRALIARLEVEAGWAAS